MKGKGRRQGSRSEPTNNRRRSCLELPQSQSRPSASAKPSTVGRPCIATASRWCDRSLKVAAAGVFFGIHL